MTTVTRISLLRCFYKLDPRDGRRCVVYLQNPALIADAAQRTRACRRACRFISRCLPPTSSVVAVKVLQEKRADYGAEYEAWLRDCRLALPSGNGEMKEIRLQKSCAPCFAKFGERKFQPVGSRVLYLPWRLASGQTREKSASKTNYAVKANFYSSSFPDLAAATSSGLVPTPNMGNKKGNKKRQYSRTITPKSKKSRSLGSNNDKEMQIAPPERAPDGKRVIIEKSQREKAIYTAFTKYNPQLDPYAIQVIYRYSRPYIQIAGTKNAFTAITADNKVATWGSISYDRSSKYVDFDVSSIDVKEWGIYDAKDRLKFNKDDSVYIDGMLLRGDYFALSRRGLEWAPLSALKENAKHLFKPDLGGQEVRQLYSNNNAFVAVLADKRLVTWGHPESGGDSKIVQDSLKKYIEEGASIQHVYSTSGAFAALLTNGKVVTWGSNIEREDQEWFERKNVSKVCVCDDMFLATVIGTDGGENDNFKAWGVSENKEMLKPIYKHLQAGQVEHVYHAVRKMSLAFLHGEVASGIGTSRKIITTDLYVALLTTGEIVVWGYNQISQKIKNEHNKNLWPEKNQKVKQIVAMKRGFLLLLENKQLINLGFDIENKLRRVPIELKQDGPAVKKIFATKHAYAALLTDGSVVVGGDVRYGGHLDENLTNVKEICSNDGAFAALFESGQVRVWGGLGQGGDNNVLQYLLGNRPVSKIYSSSAAFAAVLADGKVISWGGNEALFSLPPKSIPVLEDEIDLLAGRVTGQSRQQLDEGKHLDQITIIMPGSSVEDPTGKMVILNRKVTYISKYLDEIVELNQKEVERTGEKKKGVTFVIPDFISKKTMQLIVEYMKICDGEEPPHIKMPLRFFKLEHLIDHVKASEISAYVERMGIRDMTDVLVAAGFLGIDSLINIIQARLAIMLLDKNYEEIESMLAPVVQQIRRPSERTAQIESTLAPVVQQIRGPSERTAQIEKKRKLEDQGYVGVQLSVPATKFGEEYAKQEFGDNWNTATFKGKVVGKFSKGKHAGQYAVKYDGSDKEYPLPLHLVKKYMV